MNLEGHVDLQSRRGRERPWVVGDGAKTTTRGDGGLQLAVVSKGISARVSRSPSFDTETGSHGGLEPEPSVNIRDSRGKVPYVRRAKKRKDKSGEDGRCPGTPGQGFPQE